MHYPPKIKYVCSAYGYSLYMAIKCKFFIQGIIASESNTKLCHIQALTCNNWLFWHLGAMEQSCIHHTDISSPLKLKFGSKQWPLYTSSNIIVDLKSCCASKLNPFCYVSVFRQLWRHISGSSAVVLKAYLQKTAAFCGQKQNYETSEWNKTVKLPVGH